jgi:DNA-binding PadR family transcriptional regulator
MNNVLIGKTEEIILLTLARIGTASAVAIRRAISEHHPIALGAVYTILTRMVDKGWVERTEPTERRGKDQPRGYFTILPEGREAVKDSLLMTKRFVNGVNICHY